jgi:hypothetical protein
MMVNGEFLKANTEEQYNSQFFRVFSTDLATNTLFVRRTPLKSKHSGRIHYNNFTFQISIASVKDGKNLIYMHYNAFVIPNVLPIDMILNTNSINNRSNQRAWNLFIVYLTTPSVAHPPECRFDTWEFLNSIIFPEISYLD